MEDWSVFPSKAISDILYLKVPRHHTNLSKRRSLLSKLAWCRGRESDSRHEALQAPAPPLSYLGIKTSNEHGTNNNEWLLVINCLLLVFLLVDQRGIEPPTSSVQTRRSSQLSYWPKKRETIIPRGALDVKECRSVKLCTFHGYICCYA